MNTQSVTGFFKNVKNIKPKYLLLIILLFALFIRMFFFIGLGRRDDIAFIQKAYSIMKGSIPLPGSSGVDAAGTRIMVYFPIAFFFYLFGISEFTASLYFILCSLGSVTLAFLLGKYFFDERTGLVAALLLSFFPHEVIYSTQIIPDIPIAFYLGLTALLFILGEKNNSKKFFLLSGLIYGIAYTTKESYITFGFFLATYFTLNLIIKVLSRKKIQNLKYYLLFIVGFLIIFSVENVFYLSQGKDLFTNIIVNKNNIMLEKNGNPNLNHYYYMMFNLYPDEFEHRIFGHFYFAIFFSLICLLIKDFKKSFFIIVWFLVVFFTYQYISTIIAGRTYIEREDKYLTVLTLPAILLIARLFTIDKKISPIFGIIFLFITSIPALTISYEYSRTIIDDIRDPYLFLKDLPEKEIFIPEGVHPQMEFFFGYKKSNFLKVYHENVEWGKITDAYVVINVTPTDTYNWKKSDDIPQNWQLLKTIYNTNESFYKYYNPQIYYAPL